MAEVGSFLAQPAVWQVLVGGLISAIVTFFVARCYYRKAQSENRALLQQAEAELRATVERYTTMLQTFAIVQEQLAEKPLFPRGEDGRPDLSRPLWIEGKADATLPPLTVEAEGR